MMTRWSLKSQAQPPITISLLLARLLLILSSDYANKNKLTKTKTLRPPFLEGLSSFSSTIRRLNLGMNTLLVESKLRVREISSKTKLSFLAVISKSSNLWRRSIRPTSQLSSIPLTSNSFTLIEPLHGRRSTITPKTLVLSFIRGNLKMTLCLDVFLTLFRLDWDEALFFP